MRKNVFCFYRLREQCEAFAGRNVDEENWFEIWKYAASRNNKELKETVLEFLLRHFEDLLHSTDKDIFKLDFEDFHKLLRNDRLNSNSEFIVWEAALEWMKEKEETRQELAGKILGCVRMKCLKPEDLSTVGDSPWISGNKMLVDLYGTACKLNHGMSVTNEELLLTESRACRPRLPRQLLLAIGGWSGGSPTSIIESYDCRTNRWTELDIKDIRGPRAYHGLAVLDRKIYMVGGFNGQTYFNSISCLDTIKKVRCQCICFNGMSVCFHLSMECFFSFRNGGNGDRCT